MIAICVPVTSRETYRQCAAPGIDRVLNAAPETIVLSPDSVTSYQRAANDMLDELSERPALEAAVIIHQDVELLNANVARILPARMRDPRIAVVGAVGARYRRGAMWGPREPRGARVELPDNGEPLDPETGFGFVATVDGMLLALSPWAIKNLRFDLHFEPWFHGYDVDLCLQARAHGRIVAVDDLPIRHHQIDGFRDGRGTSWIEAEIAVRRKWDLGTPPLGLNWTRGPAAQDVDQG